MNYLLLAKPSGKLRFLVVPILYVERVDANFLRISSFTRTHEFKGETQYIDELENSVRTNQFTEPNYFYFMRSGSPTKPSKETLEMISNTFTNYELQKCKNSKSVPSSLRSFSCLVWGASEIETYLHNQSIRLNRTVLEQTMLLSEVT